VIEHESKIDAMAGVPLFSRCSRADIARIAKVADEIDLRAGKVLAKEGEPGREFFVLLEGAVDVRRDTRLLPPLGPGDFFGELSLVTDLPRTATVTAVTPVRALVVTGRSFRDLMKKYPDVQRKILEAAADRLAVTHPTL
jgi:CRP-like cAMP-binding protein